jgi:hypothetical protein
VRALREHGQDPIAFVAAALATHDLLIFDDALHNAREPFEFYQRLLRDPRVRGQLRFVFVEALSIADQPGIDAYLDRPEEDISLLAKAFQDDYGGSGWRYATYLDLLRTVREVNRTLPAAERVRVIGVNPPIYWQALHTREDYDLFLDTLLSRDYAMYRTILVRAGDFKAGKGLFLTNTRHAYTHLRKAAGGLHWNCATFFHEWHPGRTLSLRVHNVTLRVEAAREVKGPVSAAGMERFDYRWARVEGGAWDRAFAANGNRPVALALAGNAFGNAPYEGNSMLDVAPGQTMADAYDAILFLAPLEQLHDSATLSFFYTPAFKTELRRRFQLLHGADMAGFLADEGAKSLDEWIEKLATAQPAKRNALVDTAKGT